MNHECGHNTSTTVPLTRSAGARLRADAPRHVLICEPQLCSYGLPYLPAMWGVLKTWWEQHAEHPGMIRWNDPVYRMDPPETIARALAEQPIDVLGLSCYTWNWRLQQRIAALIRTSHPDCLIIAGGPHPDHTYPDFFTDNPFIDAVVVKDGEIPFARILERTLTFPTMRDFHRAGRPLDDIPGLCLPGRAGALTAPPETPATFTVSHYLAQRSYYERFIAAHPAGVVAAWETSRGCPFRCSYCDWGSATMSKVRRFDMQRLHDEIDWFARSGITVIFSVDSNFGMFKSDVELTDTIVRAKQEHGFPQYFVWSNAKNVPDRTVEITRKVVRAGLDTAHTLSIQHSNLDVLAATDRENISVEKQIRVVRELQADHVPISAQLILGLPGDTPALWRRTFTDLMEWGIHDGYIVTPYHLLPNAPAAAPDYRARWQIDTIERYIYDGPGARRNTPVDPLTEARADIIVATSTFTRPDWVRMSVESSLLRALHNGGITQAIARYLRTTHALSYADFYDDLLDRFLPRSEILLRTTATLAACFSRFLDHDDHMALLPMPGTPGDQWHVEPHRWAFATLCIDLDELLATLTAHLRQQHPGITRLPDLGRYQRQLVVRPDYDARRGLTTTIDHDWPAWFARQDTVIPGEPVPEPRSTPGARLVIESTGWDDGTGRAPFDWPVGTHAAAWERWFHAIAVNRMSATRCNHQAVRLEAAAVRASA
ncbi:MAG: B12-binding domain-containing radical SAM protein [Phycisphaerales bacterium]|nr:B12-binding domain-containing radical SAM protein [Phycisphaerales bacterium]